MIFERRLKQSITRQLAVALKLFVMLFAVDAVAQNAGAFISRQDRLQLTEFYSNMLRQKLSSELKLIGVEGDASVSLTLDFDDSRVTADAETWKKSQESKAGSDRAAATEAMKSNIAELMEKYKPIQPQLPTPPAPVEAKKEEEVTERNKFDDVKGGTRLGRLNVDIANATISEIINKAQEGYTKPQPKDVAPVVQQPQAPNIILPAQPPVTLSISVPAPTESPAEPFVFKAADYIKKITVDVTLPAKTPKPFVDGLPNLVSNFLEFKLIAKGASTAGWVKVKTAAPIPEPPKVEPPKATPQTFVEGIWRPENAFLSTVVSVLILGLFVFLAMFVASRALSKGLQNALTGLGKDIAALKPAEAAAGGEDESVGKETVVAAAEESEQRGSFDQAAAGQALTRDMQNIRSQMATFIADNTFLCAEYMSDMFYDDNGLADFRDLLSFMGYAPLKPAIDQLPRAAVEKLEAYVEENRETPPNMLSGAEIAQRMYGQCVSKATLRDDAMKVFDPVRAVLIKYEDVVITKFIADADTKSIAVLLKTLTVERGNRLMKSIPANILKEAAALLDKQIDAPDQVIAQMITKLGQVAATITERSQAQRRLILRLVKTVSVSDEGMVYDLIPGEDWDIKRQIMQTKMFLRDVPFVPVKALGQAFNALPLPRRAESMIVADEALKNALNATVGTGNKRAEMLQTEIEQIQKNAKKLAEINSRKEAILESLVASVRRVVAADRRIVDQIIFAQAKALGVNPPEGLSLPDDANKAA